MATQTKSKTDTIHKLMLKEPSMAKVILLNNDYTSVEFVIEILKVVFNKNHDEAVVITQNVHNNGQGVCGIYPYDIAQAKAQEVLRIAAKNNDPLKVKLELA